MSSDNEFDCCVAGSNTFPVPCSSLRKGMHCLIDGHPVKILSIDTSKNGKHGHAKAHIIGEDIFTGKKVEECCPTSHGMTAPVITRQEYILIDIDGDYLTLQEMDGEIREDLTLPTKDDNLARHIRKCFDMTEKEFIVTVVGAMDMEGVVQIRESTVPKRF
eukprot:TRINITY_DN2678_c0_g2_i1.p1 TRINITY_DN2678_c0_g2~~TRINITY_DN2678_c0_g2_i1.p1  ORF type:complete len:182 (+),score=48.53 TRINITY_DN2678_c0_g2_i1:66-548(+)